MKNMHRRTFLTLAGLTALSGCASLRGHRSAARPNVVVIVADDLGYADLGCQGCTDFETPHIDSIAANGVRFTDGYVTCPVCSPSRAGLMTGRYQNRFGYENNSGPVESISPHFGLPDSEITLAQLAKSQGYATAAIGKWHLGYRRDRWPRERGFDEFFGFLMGGHSYFDEQRNPTNRIMRNEEPVVENEYLTDAFSREAVNFIERHENEPFFLYLSYNAVHYPMEAPKRYQNPDWPDVDQYEIFKQRPLLREIYAAMTRSMDDGVGRVLNTLRNAGLEDNTLVIFIGDNGGGQNGFDNTPLRGEKNSLTEGGIRVPYLMQWPKSLPQGSVYHAPVSSLDIFPTMAAAIGADMPTDRIMDGVDLTPYLTGAITDKPHDTLYWRYGRGYAIRHGRWKYIYVDGGFVLFDLENDISETRSVHGGHMDVVDQLEAMRKAWDAELMDPLWSPSPNKH